MSRCGHELVVATTKTRPQERAQSDLLTMGKYAQFIKAIKSTEACTVDVTLALAPPLVPITPAPALPIARKRKKPHW